MLQKSTLIKIAVGVLVVSIIWSIMKMRGSKRPAVIVTAMPTVASGGLPGYFEDDDDTTQFPQKESFADYAEYAEEGDGDSDDDEGSDEEEGFEEYSRPDFKSDLLED